MATIDKKLYAIGHVFLWLRIGGGERGGQGIVHATYCTSATEQPPHSDATRLNRWDLRTLLYDELYFGS